VGTEEVKAKLGLEGCLEIKLIQGHQDSPMRKNKGLSTAGKGTGSQDSRSKSTAELGLTSHH
jgi:hypothetical protein